jgi:hypothetical protein
MIWIGLHRYLRPFLVLVRDYRYVTIYVEEVSNGLARGQEVRGQLERGHVFTAATVVAFMLYLMDRRSCESDADAQVRHGTRLAICQPQID